MMTSTISAPPSVRPATMTKIDSRPDGVAVISLDEKDEAHNTITPTLVRELSNALDLAFGDPNVRAIVVRSGKKDSFLVGANLELLRSIRFAQDAEDASREVAQRFARLGRSAKPIVAYVHGPALGGGFELALACTASVASDDPRTVLGLPEVKLGLVPAANGLLRVAERAGLRVALDLGMTGRSLGPCEALRLGLVDDVVPAPVGLDAAVTLALRLADDPKHARTLAKKRGQARGASRASRVLFEKNPIGRLALFRKVRAETSRKTRGHYPAAERIIDLVARYGARGFRSAAELEPRVFGDLVVSETAHRLIDLFFAKAALEKDTGLESNENAPAFPVERVAVVGAGLMGAGIATVSVRSGLTVRMKDTDDAAVGRGLRYISEQLGAHVRRGSMTALERDADFARVSGAIDYSGFRSADIVIEAVFEDLDLKHSIIRDVERLVRDTCVVASNTLSIPIARIAEASSRPEMVVGMHYLRPVPKVRLLEVVRTNLTDPRAVATAVALGKKQGKTVIVVRDGTAFYTTRILVPYLNEALHLVSEGSSVESVDAAMLAWGFPVGPFQLMDAIGVDIVAHVGGVTQAAFGERMRAPEAFAALRVDDRKGKKNARGFYLYGSAAPREMTVDSTVYGVVGVTPKLRAFTSDDIALRCALAMVNEALRSLGDGVLRSALDGDIGAILGPGFPSFRGGPFRYVDVVGTTEVLRRMRSLEQRFGARFEPAPLLVEMARGGRRFYG